jgi:hypothetical protein
MAIGKFQRGKGGGWGPWLLCGGLREREAFYREVKQSVVKERRGDNICQFRQFKRAFRSVENDKMFDFHHTALNILLRALYLFYMRRAAVSSADDA